MTTETQTIRSSNPVTVLLTSNGFLFMLRIFLGAMFIYSSLHKVTNPEQFAIAVRGYKILPVSVTNLFALSLAWSELIAGIMLLLGIMTRKAAAAVLLMLVMFTAALLTTIVRGMVVDCGCFGEDGSSTGFTLVIRNLFLSAGALMIVVFDRNFWSLSRAFGKRP